MLRVVRADLWARTKLGDRAPGPGLLGSAECGSRGDSDLSPGLWVIGPGCSWEVTLRCDNACSVFSCEFAVDDRQ